MNLDILRIAETHWTEEGKIIQENHTMIYSGREKHRNGVGIAMMGFWAISDRVIMMKLEAKPFNINFMEVYAPTQDHDGTEGTREGTFNIPTICERETDVQRDVYICFMDYAKVFDRVKHFKMIECLSKIGIDDKDLQIKSETENGITSEYKIKKGV